MSTEKKAVAGFPDVENKLQAPTKKSLFERQRADAEAKRQREEAETRAVYEDFVKSFDNEEQDIKSARSASGVGRATEFGGVAKGNFTHGLGSGSVTGPSSLRGLGGERNRAISGPGSLGLPPPSLLRKRPYENATFPPKRIDKVDKGLLAFDDYEPEDGTSKKPFNLQNDDERISSREEERAVPKPTIKLASLPPGTSPAVIKALIPPKLTVENIKILPPVGPAVYSERKSMSAIVTLARETAANDIDTVVNSLQNKYLGFGYYLSLHRHLSSAVLSSTSTISMASLGTALASQPFGAKAIDVSVAARAQVIPSHPGKFAPPSSYDSARSGRTGPLLYVPVQAPQDLKQLRLIHKVIESLLTHGPEFEALLMSRPDVQKEERWAWLWDARSTGAAWYRWRLWEVLTGIQTKRGQGKYVPLFEGSSAWKAPSQPLAYEYTTRLEEFVSDSEYDSSNEDDSGDEGVRRQNHGGTAPSDTTSFAEDEKLYLNPLEKAKLTHLLARLPTTTGTLRKGDVARVTAFAIFHAGRGADEVVHMIISNIEKPFAYTSANPERKKDKEKDLLGSDEEEDSDTSAASLIGLYLISDILSCSSTSGVRHAWKYRQLFEAALKQRHVFEGLGRMESRMNWGRLRAEKWKRSVENILKLWEGWCVFSHENQEAFASLFDKPPLTAREEQEKAARESEKKALEREKGNNKWKAVETKATAVENIETSRESMDDDLDGESMDDDVDGEPMAEDEDEELDGVPMDDGDSMVEDQNLNMEISSTAQMSASKVNLKEQPTSQPRVKRPRAVDMFADSDSDEA
ncbi:hypothetical protein K3495_g6578 [Podosphaera aphanis]|nr:hypothetical protein K3495_g6578 [Podosphaera aphanis]